MTEHATEAFYSDYDMARSWGPRMGYTCSCGWHWESNRYSPFPSLHEAEGEAAAHVAREGLELYDVQVSIPYIGNGTAHIKDAKIEAHSWQEALQIFASPDYVDPPYEWGGFAVGPIRGYSSATEDFSV